LPEGWDASDKLARLLVDNRVAFIDEIKRATGCSLADAKATMQHFAVKTGTCQSCAEPLGSNDTIVECPRCRSLNLQFPVAGSTGAAR
jgi:Zn finger protein HypA/HybF involved in hydrogenase expression